MSSIDMDQPEKRFIFCFILLPIIMSLAACTAACAPFQAPQAGTSDGTELPVVNIPLSGPASSRRAEISGMAWYSDTLVLLPQYPERFSGGALFTLPKSEITGYLEGKISGPLSPGLVPFEDGGLSKILPGFEGFEAIVFGPEQKIFLTVETHQNGAMLGYLVSGDVLPDLKSIRMNPAPRAEIPPQAGISNMTDESLLLVDHQLLTFYEANGKKVNPNPVAHIFDESLQPEGVLAVPNIEYRITDATPPDRLGNFWVINYFFPGDIQLKPAQDPFEAGDRKRQMGLRASPVERLVELHFSTTGITFVGTPPLRLRLSGGWKSRNWEALARLDERGFLLATDQYPETILAFVKLP